ncbi:MAG: exodeoxyribonuclease VII large subunit [Bacteroidaceae bacterium]|nr:exodeoxyribonuclease VII large subunit [Bacteroidaceae bacterium]MBR1754950.1 exodeoxyribonuclease VII large subunit [Bacteroidaceae bacterium]
MNNETLTLYELNNLVRSVLEQTLDGEYWLEAELAEARLAQNGHFYVEFIQKDAAGRALVAKARGTMWARTYHLLAPLFERATGERLRAGLKVRVQVTVEFHELYGFSLNIVNIDPSYTMGDMARRRREILAQLEADGILEDNRSLPLPTLLRRIAVVSSAGAAGYGDFCNQLQQNEYGLHFDIRLFPATMQGANVEESVLAALAAIADEAEQWDCVVIIRGGGATSDLSDFDTYSLAAAVAQMPLPVIVGIGHERDETVLDFVAHTRVKTPTAAAAFLIEHQAQLLAALQDYQSRITQLARLCVENERQRLLRLSTLLPRSFALVHERQLRRLEQVALRLSAAPRQRLLAAAHRVELLQTRLSQASQLRLQSARFRLQTLDTRLAALDPVLLLRRGYSLTYTSDGRLLRSVADVRSGDTLTTRLADGTLEATVNHKAPHNPS